METRVESSAAVAEPAVGASAGPRYRRILLKLSGQAFRGDLDSGVHDPTVEATARVVKAVWAAGVETAIVVGAGNIFRGYAASEQEGTDRATADYMGMIATVINALALQDKLERMGVPTRVQSAIEMRAVAEPFIRRRAIRHLEKGRVVIFAAGTGNPFFTTDTAAALRAAEIGAEVILKATHDVDGVYDSDPLTNPQAQRIGEIDYIEILSRELKVMDATAISLSMDNNLPIHVFNIRDPENIRRVVFGDNIGTIVRWSASHGSGR